MSLTDPMSKMSKSDPSLKSRILLTDTPDQVIKKVKSAVTDTGTEVSYDRAAKPGISNLLEIFSVFSDRSTESLVDEYADSGYGTFKIAVGEAIAEVIGPIAAAYESFSAPDVAELMARNGAEARERAEAEMVSVRKAAPVRRGDSSRCEGRWRARVAPSGG
jgi:tryptophanyl-tRNA synthetase